MKTIVALIGFSILLFSAASSNAVPIADAGVYFPVSAGDTVTLDGSASSATQGAIVSYSWQQIGEGAFGFVVENEVELLTPNSVTCSFVAPDVDEEAVLTFELTVQDNFGNSSSDECTVTVFPKDDPSPPDPTDPDDPQQNSFRVYLPHITGGASDWNEFLQVDNLSSEVGVFQLTLYDSSGASVFERNFSVDALSKVQIVVKALSDEALCGEIFYTNSALIFRSSQENNLAGGVAEFRLTGELSDSLAFLFSDFTSAVAWKGMAMSNFGDSTLTVTLSAIGDGATLESTEVSIGPNQKIIGLHQDWFPSVAVADLNAITATTTEDALCGVAIAGNSETTGGSSFLLFTTAAPYEISEGGTTPTPPAPQPTQPQE